MPSGGDYQALGRILLLPIAVPIALGGVTVATGFFLGRMHLDGLYTVLFFLAAGSALFAGFLEAIALPVCAYKLIRSPGMRSYANLFSMLVGAAYLGFVAVMCLYARGVGI